MASAIEKISAYELSLEGGFAAANTELNRKKAKHGGKVSEATVDEVLDKVFDPILDAHADLEENELFPRLTAVTSKIRSAFLPEQAVDSKSGKKVEDPLSAETDPWIMEKRQQIIEVIARFESELNLNGQVKQKIETDKQIELQQTLIEKLTPLAGDIDEKRLYYLDLTERLNSLIKLADDLAEFAKNPPADKDEADAASAILDARQTAMQEALAGLLASLKIPNDLSATSLKRMGELVVEFEEKIKKYELLGEDLRSKMGDFNVEWGLDKYKNKVEHKDVEEMTATEIIDYVIENEIPFWESLHLDSDDDFIRKLIFRLKYNLPEKGKGWEQNTSREGTGNDYWASLEGRENMVRLQIFAVYAHVLRGKPYAEGDRTKLFEGLDKFKLSREQMILATTENPRYGKFLSKVLEISQDWPTLRTGKLPDEANLTAEDRAALKERLDAAGGNYKNISKLNDRVVIRGGKRVFLAGDRLIEVIDESKDINDPSRVISHKFTPGEKEEDGEEVYLEANSKYSYNTLSGNLGKEVAKMMQKDIIAMIRDKKNFKKFGLKESDVSDSEEVLDKVGYFAFSMFYSFPFLTYILAKSQERTQTAAHGKDLHDEYDWGLVFSPLGKAIHESDRYGDFVSWMWLLIYYKELKNGMFGAGGDPDRINEFRKLLIAHQRALFGHSVDDYVGKIDLLETFGESEFTSPYKMVTLAPTEHVRLMGKEKWSEPELDADGKPIKVAGDPSAENPRKIGPGKDEKTPDPAHSFDLLNVAISGWVKLLQSVVEEIPVGSVTSENMRSKGKNKGLLGELFAVIAGTLKMWETGSVTRGNPSEHKKQFNALQGFAQYAILHKIDRLFHAAESGMIADRKKMFQAAETQLSHAIGLTGGGGGLAGGASQQMGLWILNRIRGEGDHEKYGKDTGLFGSGFKGMRSSFSPPPEFGNSDHKDYIIDYLELLWNWTSKYSGGNILGPFPLSKKSDSVLGFKTARALTAAVRMSQEREDIDRFSGMALHPHTIQAPLQRHGLETSSSKSDK